jgi:ubiquinone/menaquinone biosynthesis C-methylase UbiE
MNFPPRARVSRFAIAATAALWSSLLPAQQARPPADTRPANERVARYERPDRVALLKVDEVIRALAVKPGQVVADVGAGSGVFSRPFAKAVRPSGRVLAVDVDREVLEFLKESAAKEKLANIETVVSREDDPLLPARSVDLAFFCDSLHHIADRVPFLKKVREAMKEEARLAVIDYAPDASLKGFCPHRPDELLPVWQVVKEMDEAGFALSGAHDFLPRNYFLVFAKR